jgi:hypothetical protein
MNVRGWSIFVSLCSSKAWVDLIECVFDLLQKWALGSTLFNPDMMMSVLEFVPFAQLGSEFNPFRLNF